MGKHILCAVLIAGFLFPCGWLRAEGNNNEATKPIKSKSTENENIYVKGFVPLDKEESNTYDVLSKESQGLMHLKAGDDQDTATIVLTILGICVIISIMKWYAKGGDEVVWE